MVPKQQKLSAPLSTAMIRFKWKKNHTNHPLDYTSWRQLCGLIGLGTATCLLYQDSSCQKSHQDKDQILNLEEVKAKIRQDLMAFRDAHEKNHHTLPKLQIMQNGPVVRIQLKYPDTVDSMSILRQFMVSLQQSEYYSGKNLQLNSSTVKTTDSVDFVFSDLTGSVVFDIKGSNGQNKALTFYKDDALTIGEVDALVAAYKKMFSVNTTKNRIFINRSPYDLDHRENSNSSMAVDSKESAIELLNGMGITVFEGDQESITGSSRLLNWDSLAGYDNVKEVIEDTVVLALQNPQDYEELAKQTRCRFESPRPRAVLLEGPPGTGKTLTAKIIASQSSIPMIHLPLESVVSKWYGEAEKNMSQVFQACEKLGAENGGAIIFIDEIDALASDRGSGNMHEVSRRLLSVLLTKIEGFDSSEKYTTTLICATNRKQDLDSALLSRFDFSIRFELPDEPTRKAVFQRYARHLSEKELKELASLTQNFSCREIKEVCEYTERRWVSHFLRAKKNSPSSRVELKVPDLNAYESAIEFRMRGSQSHFANAQEV